MIDRILNPTHGARLLIFDFDGTVVETTLLHARAFVDVLEPFGVPVDYSTAAGLETPRQLRLYPLVGSRGRGIRPALVSDKQRRVR